MGSGYKRERVLPGVLFPGLPAHENIDILCIQETKADAHSLKPDITYIPDYFHINPAERKGYSGVVMYSRTEPESPNWRFSPSLIPKADHYRPVSCLF